MLSALTWPAVALLLAAGVLLDLLLGEVRRWHPCWNTFEPLGRQMLL